MCTHTIVRRLVLVNLVTEISGEHFFKQEQCLEDMILRALVDRIKRGISESVYTKRCYELPILDKALAVL